jgi:glycosyltransferase involved in cell wall biosynthesis
MEDFPKVSIITVCLNKKEFLEKCINSVISQIYKNIEYIIIDGGSNDGSLEILNKYRDKINKLVIEKDNGIYDAMNKGIALASGEIIYFLNSDDRFYDNHVIEGVVPLFTGNEEIDFVYGNIEVFNPMNKASYIERYPERISKALFITKTIGHPATFFRAPCFKRAGLFDERYKIAGDYEWFLRAVFTKGLRGMHVERNVSVFTLGGVSTDEKNLETYLHERALIQRKYFNNLEILVSRLLSGVKRARNRCLKMRI